MFETLFFFNQLFPGDTLGIYQRRWIPSAHRCAPISTSDSEPARSKPKLLFLCFEAISLDFVQECFLFSSLRIRVAWQASKPRRFFVYGFQ